MPAHLLLYLLEGFAGAHEVRHEIVKPQHHRVQLRDDDVFVIARVADQRARAAGVRMRFGFVARQISRVLINAFRASQPAAQFEMAHIVFVQIGLIRRAAPVEAVQIEARRAEIYQRVRVALFFQAADRIKRQVMVNELT